MKLLILGCALAVAVQAKPAAPAKADIVAVGGCLRETSPDVWTLVAASDPVVTPTANAPSAKEAASIAKNGKNEYRLTGVTVFNLPAHRGHNVLVKGLLNKATPMSRLNITALTMVSAECPAVEK
jgi:hypothetical protein